MKAQINILKLPIKVVLIYLIITYIMYCVSPWNWERNNLLLTTVFNIIVWVMLYWGYKLGISKRVPLPLDENQQKNFFDKPYWTFLAILSILCLYPMLLVRFQTDTLSLSYILSKTFLGGLSLKDAYMQRGENVMQVTSAFSSPAMFLGLFGSPFAYVYRFVSLYYWREINRFHKFVVIFIVAVDILGYIAIGTNKGIFDYVITLPLIILASQKNNRIYSFNMSYKKITVLTIGLMLALNFFGNSYVSRTEDKAIVANRASGNNYIDYNATMFKILPSEYHIPYLGLDFYLSHAYDGLDRAMNMEFIPCYGLGNSPMINTWAKKVGLGGDIDEQRYENRIAKQRGVWVGQYWDTAYVAFANDVTFWGVPFVVFLFAYFYGYIWKRMVVSREYLAVPLAMLMTIEMFYLNANNQIFGKTQFNTFVFIFLYWLFKRRKATSYR